MKNKICCWIILLGCTGCHLDLSSYKSYRTLSKERWIRDSVIAFKAQDLVPGEYQLKIRLRHTTDYMYANLRCFLSIHRNNQPIKIDTINLILADDNGDWLGDGMKGLKTIIQPVGKIAPSDSCRSYTFYLWHSMRNKELKGIKNIGIELEASGNTKE